MNPEIDRSYRYVTRKPGIRSGHSFDRIEGPIRGLQRVWTEDLRSALDQFIRDLNERGYWH